jgi:hypothetical protein
MIKLVLVILIALTFSTKSLSGNLVFGSGSKKSKGEYEHSKCIENSTNYRERLTYEEVCKYGVSCPSVKTKDKITMYCMESNLSECFVNKSWKTDNQLVGVPGHKNIGLLTQGLSFKQGVRAGKTCAYYD